MHLLNLTYQIVQCRVLVVYTLDSAADWGLQLAATVQHRKSIIPFITSPQRNQNWQFKVTISIQYMSPLHHFKVEYFKLSHGKSGTSVTENNCLNPKL